MTKSVNATRAGNTEWLNQFVSGMALITAMFAKTALNSMPPLSAFWAKKPWQIETDVSIQEETEESMSGYFILGLTMMCFGSAVFGACVMYALCEKRHRERLSKMVKNHRRSA